MDRPETLSQRPGGERRLGRYELISPVGTTALGGLYRGRIAFGAEKGRDVLVRRLQKGKVNDDATLQAIRENAAEVSGVRHPSVTGILEVRLGTSLVVATEHAEGVPLRSLMSATRRRGPPLTSAVSLRIVVELLRTMTDATSALEAAGLARPLVGVCPDAVLVGEGGTVVAADLALLTLARPPRSPDLMAYRAPEQLGALAEGDARSELFSVGVIWWELLANRTLFGGDNQAMVWQRVRQGSIPPPPGAADDVRALVMTLLDRNPDARLRDVDEVMSVVQELGADHIADWDAATRALDELASLIERGEFPSVTPPPDLWSLPPGGERKAGRTATAEPRTGTAEEAEEPGAQRPTDASRRPVVAAGGPAPQRSRKPSVRKASSPTAQAVQPMPGPAGVKSSGAAPPRPSSSGALVAVRPSSFAPAPLPQGIPDEGDWGANEELSDLDLTSIRPDASDGVAELSELDLESLRPEEAPPAAVRSAAAKRPAIPRVTGNKSPPRPPLPRPAQVPAAAERRRAPEVQPDPAKQVELAEAADAAAEPELAEAAGAATEPELAEAAGAATEPELAEAADATTEPELAEAADAASEPELTAPKAPDSAPAEAAPLPAFATDEERPVEETLGEVLRDAARPIAASAVQVEEEREAPAVPEPFEAARAEPTLAHRSPLGSDVDEVARVSAIENMAAEVREQRRLVAMPVDEDGRAASTKQSTSAWPARLFVVGVFVATSLAAFFGWRAVLLAPGARVAVPEPSAITPAKESQPAAEEVLSALLPSSAVSAAPSASAEVAAPESPPEAVTPVSKPAPDEETKQPPPPRPVGTSVAPRSGGEVPPAVEPAAPKAPAVEPTAPKAPAVEPTAPPATDPVAPEDDPYG